jgi:hypothetical protein
MNFNVTHQLLIRFFHFPDTGEKWDYDETVHQLFIDFKKATETLIDPSKGFGLQVNTEKIK